MYPYIKCPTCNTLLGHLFILFKEMRAIKNEHNEEDLLDVFKLLHINNWCCKTRMMTVREFNEFLHAK